MANTTLTKLTTIPIEGVDCVLVDGAISRILLPGGIEITAPYSSLSVTGPKPVELKVEAPKAPGFDADIGF